ncbi:hypothetical protein ID0992_12870 [Helicobacter pylori]
MGDKKVTPSNAIVLKFLENFLNSCVFQVQRNQMGKSFIVVMERLSIPTKQQKQLCSNAKKKQKVQFEH